MTAVDSVADLQRAWGHLDGAALLTAVVARLAPPSSVDELSLAAWSLVHGYSMLCIETHLEASVHRAERVRLFARIIGREAAAACEAVRGRVEAAGSRE